MGGTFALGLANTSKIASKDAGLNPPVCFSSISGLPLNAIEFSAEHLAEGCVMEATSELSCLDLVQNLGD